MDGDDLPEVGTVNLGSAAQLYFDTDAFKNAYLINTIILADDTSFSTDMWLEKSFTNTVKNNPYSNEIKVNLVCTVGSAAEEAVMEFVRRIKVQRLRSKTVTPGGVELTVEVQLRERFDIVNKLLDTEGVHTATLIACQSEAGN